MSPTRRKKRHRRARVQQESYTVARRAPGPHWRPLCARGSGCSRPPHISLPGARPGCTARLCHSPATCVWVSHISHLSPRCSTVDGVKLRVLVTIKRGSAHGALSPEPGRQKCPRASVSFLSPTGHNEVLMTPIFPASRIQPCPCFGQ